MQNSWEYCPECGCKEYKRADWNNENQCAECMQEWFPDIDYTDTVRGHLKASQPTRYNKTRTDNTAQLREALDSSLQTNQAICKKMMMLQDLLLETISTFRHIGLNMKFGDIPNKDAIEGYCKKIETALAGK